MKARIERDWARNAMKVWLYQADASGAVQVVGVDEHGELLLRRLEPGELMPTPTFILPTDALAALLAEAAGVLPPSETTVDAMRDARDTRDRLLSLIEKRGLR